MKGKTLVIVLLIIVVLTVGGIYLAMMSTINGIKEEQEIGVNESMEASFLPSAQLLLNEELLLKVT